MSKFVHSILLCLFVFWGQNSAVLGGPLEKYGSEPRYRSYPEPQPNPRQNAINRAVQGINNATGERRERLVEEYRRRAEMAIEEKRYDEARFYTEILSRTGY